MRTSTAMAAGTAVLAGLSFVTPPAAPAVHTTGSAAAAPGHAPVQGAGPTCHGLPATIVGNSGDEDIHGTPGRDVVLGARGGDVIHTGAGDDVVCGGPGDDDVFSGTGDDMVYGEGGQDTVSGGRGSDLLDGVEPGDARTGSGDTLSYAGGALPVRVSLTDHLSVQGRDRDVVRRFGTVYATSFDDVILGGREAERLYGLDGDDRVAGGDRYDVIVGGNGDDVLTGGAGLDNIVSGTGANHVIDFHGRTKVTDNGAGSLIQTGLGDDNILALGGAGTTVHSRGGNDQISVADSSVLSGTGDDEVTVYGLPIVRASVSLGLGSDRLYLAGTGGEVSFQGGAGIDGVRVPDSGSVTLRLGVNGSISSPFTGALVDFERATTGKDADILVGSAGVDHLFGGRGDDRIRGLAGDDLLDGEEDDDTVDGGLGHDRCLQAETRSRCETTQ